MITRRTMLKGLGTAMALPMLEAMLPARGPAVTAPRMAFLFTPNGMDMTHFTPTTEGALGRLPYILEPLEPVKGKIDVLSGLAQLNARALGDGPGDHARSSAVWLTGVHPHKTAGADIAAGISADQVAAQAIGHKTRFPSLELGCERGAVSGQCDSGYACVYSNSIAWASPDMPIAKEINPRSVFDRLFGSGDAAGEAESRFRRDQLRQSIVDFVLQDALALRNRLGLRDQQKIDEYLAGVRDVERRLQKVENEEAARIASTTERPAGAPSDRGEHIRLMGDMMVLAFQADLTRIGTFMFANEGSNRPYREIEISDGHHDMSHHGNDPAKLEKKREIDRYHVEQLAYILAKMDSVEELDSTLLDNSMIVFGGGIGDGNRHNHDDLPIVLAGGAASASGAHIRFPQHTPMNNLFLSLLDRVGVEPESLGDSTGKLQRLL